MIELTLADVARATGGKIIVGNKESKVTGISIDSRAIEEGDLFLALEGENYDGHDYAFQAIKNGASGLIVSKQPEAKTKRLIKVADSLKALQKIANYNRRQLAASVVGITGSTGKTTTKDMLHSILNEKFSVVSSKSNFNNEIGVPLTLLRANKNTQVVVVEMAMRGRGEIKLLCDIAQPEIGLVTNIGQTHLSLLGSVENVVKAKSELVQKVPPTGAVFLNDDDQWAKDIKKLAEAEVVTYGASKTAQVRASKIKVDKTGRPSFVIFFDKKKLSVRLSLPGQHNVYNALGAAAVAYRLGSSLISIKKGLEAPTISELRMEVVKLADKVILNDCYNANPMSMKAALDALSHYQAKRKVAILGDMLELGKISVSAHRQIGKEVMTAGVNLLITIGELSKEIAQVALAAGFDKKAIFSFNKIEQSFDTLKQELKPGDVILVKASRAMLLEKVTRFIESLPSCLVQQAR